MRTYLLPVLMVLIGIALIARTLASGGSIGALGLIFGVLFMLAGAARIYIGRKL